MSNYYPCVCYDNGKCQKFSDEKYNSWCDFDQCEFITPSNADHIRSMTDEELATFLAEVEYRRSVAGGGAIWLDNEGAMVWLKQPYKEDT